MKKEPKTNNNKQQKSGNSKREFDGIFKMMNYVAKMKNNKKNSKTKTKQKCVNFVPRQQKSEMEKDFFRFQNSGT